MNPANKPSIPSAGLPRVLLVEDEPTSRTFLSTVVRAIPAQVDCADSLAAALALAVQRSYDLWLLDVQLPDGGGDDLLMQLQALQPGVPALAHTASTEPALGAALIATGFAEVLVKPLQAAALQSAVQRALGMTSSRPAVSPPADAADSAGHDLRLWDDEAAARALNFNRTHIEALRRLFLDELPQATRLIIAASHDGDCAAMAAGLHKLRASCGFVGAARLAASVDALQRDPSSSALVAGFDRAARATAATAAQSGGSGPDPCGSAGSSGPAGDERDPVPT